jgi:hypothetical protein
VPRNHPVLLERLFLRLAVAMRGVSARTLYASLGIGLAGVVVYGTVLLVRGGPESVVVGVLLGLWIVGAPVLYALGARFGEVSDDYARRMKGLVLGNAVFFAALCCAHIAGSKVISWRLRSWMRDGETIAAALDTHRARTGSFPGSLDDLPRETPRPPSRWFRYWTRDGGEFTLIVVNPRLLGYDGWKFRSDARSWQRFWD